MSKFDGHTEGPWESVGWGVYQTDPGNREIVFSQHNTRSADGDERAANARLIAAAPDLLRACETMRMAISELPAVGGTMLQSDADRLIAALALVDEVL